MSNKQNQSTVLEGEIVVETPEFRLYNKKRTYAEVVAALGIKEASKEKQLEVIERMIKKGVLSRMEQLTKEEKVLQQVALDMAVDEQISLLEAEKKAKVDKRNRDKNEDKAKHDEVSFTIATEFDANKVATLIDGMTLEYKAVKELGSGEYEFTVYDITQAQLGKISRYLSTEELMAKTRDLGDKAINITGQTVKTAVEGIVAPLTKGAVSVTVSTTKSVVKAATQVGASLVTKSVEETQKLSQELGRDVEVLKARQSLTALKDAALRKFRSSSTSDRFKIK